MTSQIIYNAPHVKRFIYSLMTAIAVFVLLAILRQIQLGDGLVVVFVLVSIILVIGLMISWHAVYQITVDDTTCTFVSMRRQVTLLVSDLLVIQPRSIRGIMPLTTLIYKHGYLIIAANLKAADAPLQPFIDDITQRNPQFTVNIPSLADLFRW